MSEAEELQLILVLGPAVVFQVFATWQLFVYGISVRIVLESEWNYSRQSVSCLRSSACAEGRSASSMFSLINL